MFPSDLAALLRTMTPTDLAARLRAAATATVNPLAPVAELGTELPPYAPGQRLVARILAPLPDGSFRASVEGRTIRIHLDQPAQAGDQLELEVTGHQDKSVLARQVATPLRQAPQPATAAPPHAAAPVAAHAPAAVTTLSAAGQRIADALAFDSADTPTVAATRAALPAGVAEPAKIAAAIGRAVTQSGLFYEAHQARWVEGRLPLTELFQEPQARMAATQPQPAAAMPPAASPAPSLSQSLSQHLSQPMPAPAEAAAHRTAAPAGAAEHEAPEAARAAPATAPRVADDEQAPPPERAAIQRSGVGELAAELRPLVHQQLNALAQQQVSLQLPLWPGIDMQLEILDPRREAEESAGDGAREATEAPPWRSRLRLELPHLGEITAVLELRASRLALSLHASHDTAARLAAHGADLRHALEQAGLGVDGMLVGERE